jgi:hypothetical protein
MLKYLLSFFYTEQKEKPLLRDTKELNRIIYYYKEDSGLTSIFTKKDRNNKNGRDLLEKTATRDRPNEDK